MKVHRPEKGHRLNYKMLAAEFNMVDTPEEADICIGWRKCYDLIPYNKQIVCQSEPPIVRGVRHTYRNAAKWHTFVTFRPRHPNSIRFSDTAPHLFPYWSWQEMRVRRPDDELRAKGKGIYYAGHKSCRPDRYSMGGDIIYNKRSHWAAELVKELGGVCLGNGWPQTSKDAPEGWGAKKFQELAEGDYDFHFCAENCLLEGYHSEKFHHGMLCGRVCVYMGHKGIKDLVDPTAYVYALDFDSPAELAEYLKAMTPEEYRERVHAAQAFLDSIGEQSKQAMNDLTQKIIERIKA